MTLVQRVNYSAISASTSHTITFASATAGNKIVVLGAVYFANTAYTSGYSRDVYVGGSVMGTNEYLAVWSKDATGGETSFNITIGTSGLSVHLQMMEVSDVGAYSAHQYARLPGTGTTVTAPGSLVIPANGHVFAIAGLHAPTTLLTGTWSNSLSTSLRYTSTANNTGQFGWGLNLGAQTTTYSISGLDASSNGADVVWVAFTPDQTISTTGIASAETFGTTAVFSDKEILTSGIATAEGFGSPSLGLGITTTGIPSAEAFGSHLVLGGIQANGIVSAEAFGVPSIFSDLEVAATGLASLEAFGSPSLEIGYPQQLIAEGLASLEGFGSPAIVNRQIQILLPRRVKESPMARNILHVRFGIDRGISIIKRMDGTYYETRYPAQTDLESAAEYYLGGCKHYLTPEQAAGLIGAGFGALIHYEDLPNDGGYTDS